MRAASCDPMCKYWKRRVRVWYSSSSFSLVIKITKWSQKPGTESCTCSGLRKTRQAHVALWNENVIPWMESECNNSQSVLPFGFNWMSSVSHLNIENWIIDDNVTTSHTFTSKRIRVNLWVLKRMMVLHNTSHMKVNSSMTVRACGGTGYTWSPEPGSWSHVKGKGK